MFYVTKKTSLISDDDFKKAQELSNKCALYSLKSISSIGRRKRYYSLRLLRARRDREKLLAVNRPAWEEVRKNQKKSG